MEKHNNSVTVLKLMDTHIDSNEQPQAPNSKKSLVKVAEFSHEYPASKIQWAPESTQRTDFLATGGEIVRIWQTIENEKHVKHLWDVRQSKDSDMDQPLTCFDWSKRQPNLLATSMLNGIVCIWDLNSLKVNYQLLAHSEQVNTIAFTGEENQFATGGQDGQVRFFDLRDLQTSSVAYQADRPVTQIVTNQSNPHQVAFTLADSDVVNILDARYPSLNSITLRHESTVNSIAWFPGQNVLCTAGENSDLKIFDVNESSYAGAFAKHFEQQPTYQFSTHEPAYQISWSTCNSQEYLGLSLQNQVQIL